MKAPLHGFVGIPSPPIYMGFRVVRKENKLESLPFPRLEQRIKQLETKVKHLETFKEELRRVKLEQELKLEQGLKLEQQKQVYAHVPLMHPLINYWGKFKNW